MGFEPDSENGIGVAIIGANGNVGRLLLEELIHAPFPVSHIRLLGNPIKGLQRINIEGHDFPIHPWREDISDNPQLEGVDLVYLAAPASVSKDIGAGLRSEGIACIDFSGSDSTWGWALSGVNVNWEAFREHRYLAIPGSASTLWAHVMASLIPLGAAAGRATFLMPASIAGAQGASELSEQVVALFNTKSPPRKVFDNGLAFDVLPSWGPSKGGWTQLEASIAVELANVLGTHPSRFISTVNIVPTFSGLSVSLHISFEGSVELEAVENALEQSRILELEEPLLGPQHWIGMNRIGVGRLRLDPLGDGIHLWATADEIRALGVRNALSLLSTMHSQQLL
ncbi:MAG: Asd/ArgC dimerization domain-containing protein [Myxococcota bacterium]|nr:Asd/ArgC dimerization domain-containing protein [Myxococcota bacterium]